MAAPLIKSMIVDALGYCCEYAFFCHFKRTTQISERLGVSRYAIQKHKAAVRDGCSTCTNAANCQKKAGHLVGKRAPR